MPARRARVPEIDEAIAVFVGQRPQQHAVDRAEHRRVRPDPQAQGHDENEARTRVLAQPRAACRTSLMIASSIAQSSHSVHGYTRRQPDPTWGKLCISYEDTRGMGSGGADTVRDGTTSLAFSRPTGTF